MSRKSNNKMCVGQLWRNTQSGRVVLLTEALPEYGCWLYTRPDGTGPGSLLQETIMRNYKKVESS